MRFKHRSFLAVVFMTLFILCFGACGGGNESSTPTGTADVESIEITNTETTLTPGEYEITARCLPSNSPQGFTARLNGSPKSVSLELVEEKYILTVGATAADKAKITVSVTSTDDPSVRGIKEFTLSIPELEYTMIHNEDELRAIADDMSGRYKLANDIELTKPWVQLGDAQHEPDAAPIIPSVNPFKGVLDGAGHSIKNIRMDDTSTDTGYDRGFFGRIDAAGTVRNIGFDGGQMQFRGWSGVIAAQNYGTIENVFTNVDIYCFGGVSAALVVTNGGVIKNCYAIGKTTSDTTDNTAGVIGATNGGSITGVLADLETTQISYFAGGHWESGNQDWNLNYLKVTEMMQTADTYKGLGWDEEIWELKDGSYPTLKARS